MRLGKNLHNFCTWEDNDEREVYNHFEKELSRCVSLTYQPPLFIEYYDRNNMDSVGKYCFKDRKVRIPIIFNNFKDVEAQIKFNKATPNTTILSSIFENNEKTINDRAGLIMKRLTKLIYQCFKKIRIGKNKEDPIINKLFDKRRKLRLSDSATSTRKLEKDEKLLGLICSKKYVDIIEGETKDINCEIGGMNSGKLWQMKRKLCSKGNDPPSVMLNKDGILVTSNSELKTSALETFSKGFERNPIKTGLEGLEETNKKLFEEKLKIAQSKKMEPWSMKDLETVLKKLTVSKARDPNGLANILLKSNIAGNDLKRALLSMCKEIKEEQI